MKKEINIEPSIISKEKKEINIEPLTNPKD